MLRIKITLFYLFFAIIAFFYNPVYAITYQEIQDDPINLSLNLKYAEEQRVLGNTKNAMVTLERLLLLYPNDLDLTVYYLDLLIDLGSVSKASEVINQLLSKDITNQILLEELELIANDLELQQKTPSPLSINLTSTVNWGYESNTNSVSSHNRQYLGSVLSDYPLGTVRSDRIFGGNLSLSSSYSLGEHHLFSASAGFNKTDQVRDTNRMNDINSYNISYTFSQPRYSINNYATYARTDNFSSNNSIQRTGGLSANYNINDRLSASAEGSVSFTKNNETKQYITAREKDSRSQQASLGTNYFLTQADLIGVSLGYNYKKARSDNNGYIGRSFKLTYSRNLPLNLNLNSSFTRTVNKYKAEDAIYLTGKEQKTFISGTSLSLGGPIRGSTWSYAINLNWSDAESNIINYTTSGQTMGLSLTKEFQLF